MRSHEIFQLMRFFNKAVFFLNAGQFCYYYSEKRKDAIWIPIQPAWGVERDPGGPKANNSIASKVYT